MIVKGERLLSADDERRFVVDTKEIAEELKRVAHALMNPEKLASFPLDQDAPQVNVSRFTLRRWSR